VARDETDPALALAATLALTRAADKAVLDQLFDNLGLGRIVRLLHGQLFLADHPSLLDRILHPFHGPPVPGRSLRERILSLLDWLGHPLVFVPAGECLMGSNGGKADERPPHKVTLKEEYWIDKFPVTNEQFDQFVREEKDYQVQGNWRRAFKPGKEKHPVVNVTWNDARAYGKWCGKQLPTEAQWEKSARGTDGREYPWGNQWDGNKCNASGRGTTPVEAYAEDVSPYGCYGMAGNVWEWCQDWYDEGYYAHSPTRNPQGPREGSARVTRGGCWRDRASRCRSAKRGSSPPGTHNRRLGFRLLTAAPEHFL
jgi:formylglycine-generating enzyme required for sulfatase activity